MRAKARTCGSWLKKQDILSTPIHLNFKGSSIQGTSIGGCCSLLIKSILGLIVLSQLYAFFFQPSYNESLSVHYLNRESNITYDVPVTSLLQSFSICNSAKDIVQDHDLSSCNDLNYWKVAFYQRFS